MYWYYEDYSNDELEAEYASWLEENCKCPSVEECECMTLDEWVSKLEPKEIYEDEIEECL